MRHKKFILSAVLLLGLGLTGLNAQTVKDIDGNVYKTITIGTQTWMAENLKVTKYRNGDSIPNLTDNQQWENVTAGANRTGAYCDYENTPGNSTTYGKLYNGYAVNDPRGLAPNGWHVPTKSEWATLIDYLGGKDVAGDKLKEKGNAHYTSLNTGATNETGFTALPSGDRENIGRFGSIGRFGGWWSSTEEDIYSAWDLCVGYDFGGVVMDHGDESAGYSVRCVRDK
jgi:uncharacterized protein (TIGR02145 family)